MTNGSNDHATARAAASRARTAATPTGAGIVTGIAVYRPICTSFRGVVRGVLRGSCTYILDNEYGLCKRFLAVWQVSVCDPVGRHLRDARE